MIVFGPWKNCLGWPQMGAGGFVPTNPDLAIILCGTDFDFQSFYFWILWFSDFQVPRFPDWAWARLGPGLGLGWAWARLG